jgi:hypothetical protein
MFRYQTYHARQDIPGKVAISLDGWTSGNNYAFIAIVAHYIHPKTGELGMLPDRFNAWAELMPFHRRVFDRLSGTSG